MVKRKYRKRGGRRKQRGGNIELAQTSDPIVNKTNHKSLTIIVQNIL